MSSSLRAMRLLSAVIGITAALSLVTPCFASGALDALLACRRIDSSAARLACFDRTSAALAARQRPAGQHPALDPQRTFGLAPAEVAARAEAAARVGKPLEAITARITALSEAADGREIFTLDNRQVWMQLEAVSRLIGAKPGEAVRISRGWLGSYWLTLPSRRGCKVTRIR